jgi:hypothetical protein
MGSSYVAHTSLKLLDSGDSPALASQRAETTQEYTFSQISSTFLGVCVCRTGVWTQGFAVAKQVFSCLSHTSSPLEHVILQNWNFIPIVYHLPTSPQYMKSYGMKKCFSRIVAMALSCAFIKWKICYVYVSLLFI